MDTNELVNFNPILGNAFAQAEKESAAKGGVWGEMIEYLREFVALGVKTGVEPSKIYAIIKTGRILTEENMKLLTNADIKEWHDACREYERLAAAASKTE